MCEHLQALVAALEAQRIPLTAAGRLWERATGEWRYYDCVLDLAAARTAFALDPALVQVHEHRGTHDGSESGFVCAQCGDAVMGLHPSSSYRGQRFVIDPA